MTLISFLISGSILAGTSVVHLYLDQDGLEGNWKCISIVKPNSMFSDALKDEIQSLIGEENESSKSTNPYKWAINFSENGVAEYEPCFSCSKELLDYKLYDSHIILNEKRMEIVKFTSDTLVLNINDSNHILVRKE